MIKYILIIIGLIAFNSSGISQTTTDSTIRYYSHSNLIAIQDYHKRLYSSDIRVLFANHQEALAEFESGRTNLTVASIIGVPSFVLLGVGAGMLILDKDVKYAVWIIGGSGVIASLLFRSVGMSAVRNSVRIYNAEVSSSKSASLDFGLTNEGIGLSLRF